MDFTSQELVVNYLPLANKLVSEARKLLPKGMQFDDLKSAAYLGLVDAADKFDSGRAVKFGAYARLRIIGEIKDSIREFCRHKQRFTSNYDSEGNCIFDSLAIEMVVENDKMQEIKSGLSARLQKVFDLYFVNHLSLKEIGVELGVNESRVSQLLKEIRTSASESLAA